MQPEPPTLSKISDKPFGLYFFNAFVVLLIIYVQFQNIIGVPIKESMPQLSHAIFLVDKIFLFPLFLFLIYVRFLGAFLTIGGQETRRRSSFTAVLNSERTLLIALVFFSSWCLISAWINQNNMKPTIFGTFAYIVYFLIFFVFCSIPYKKNLIKKNYIFLLYFVLFLSILSIFQEILALTYPSSINWWPNIQEAEERFRFGFFRAPSLLGHANSIGMIALFFWTVELGKVREIGLGKNTIKLTLLGLAILFSLSRAAIGGALISLFLLVWGFSRRRTALLALIVGAALIGFLGIKSIYPAGKRGEVGRHEIYREYSFGVSLQVFRDHPITGVGPGMYGGHVSIRYDSPIYNQYGFTGEYFNYLKYGVMSIEQLWLQALAELGVLGTALLTLLLLTPIIILSKLLSRENDSNLRGLIRGLRVMPLQMMIYMFGFTITQESQWLVPYFGFLGMLAGLRRRR